MRKVYYTTPAVFAVTLLSKCALLFHNLLALMCIAFAVVDSLYLF
jgi:hypothetical protein